jgi:rSAM/selenodomain-associated transferase 2
MAVGEEAGIISILIPTLNEAERLPRLLGDLSTLTAEHEIIVADGGSTDATRSIAAAAGCRVLSTGRGRGAQLAAAANSATGEWLLALHADARISPEALVEAATALAGPAFACGVWSLEIDGKGLWLRVVEHVARWRSRCLGLPYGDQGLLVRRDVYLAAGGYPDTPIMEDVALVRRIGSRVRIRHFEHSIRADSRRYHTEGRVRRVLLNMVLLTLFLCGVPARRLAEWYVPHRERS